MKCSQCGLMNVETAKYCANCGSILIDTGLVQCQKCGSIQTVGGLFCSSCGEALSYQGAVEVSKPPLANGRKSGLVRQLVKTVLIWSSIGALLTGILFLSLLFIQKQKYLNGGYVPEAAQLAVEFVAIHYPELADVDPDAYFGSVDGKNFYIVDFIRKDPDRPSEGVRILVDQFLRVVFAYEHIFSVSDEVIAQVQSQGSDSVNPAQGTSDSVSEGDLPCMDMEIVLEEEPGLLKLPPSTPFTKTFWLKNTGSCTWTSDYHVYHISGEPMGGLDEWQVPRDFPPGSEYGFVLELTSPAETGYHTGVWSVTHPDGYFFGQVKVEVEVTSTSP